MLALLIAVMPALGQQSKVSASKSAPSVSASASASSASLPKDAKAPQSATTPPTTANSASPPGAGSASPGASAAPNAPPAGIGPSEPGLAPALAPAAASTRTPAGAASAPLDGASYAVRLRDLEARVDELKEQIRRSHTRLSLLSDTILSGGIGGARAEITFKNELSGAFRVTRVLVVLDGAVQYNKQDDAGSC